MRSNFAIRGFTVTLLDAGPVPHPLAASSDISKVVRIEYGADEVYMALAEKRASAGSTWNRDLFQAPLYHETGATFLTRQPMAPGGYEYENFRMLTARGHAPQRLTPSEIRQRFPAWNADRYVDGYFNPKAGFVESGKVIECLVRAGTHAGNRLFQDGGQRRECRKAAGEVRLASGEVLTADVVVVAAGAWTPTLLPELASVMRSTGQPVFHLRARDPARFSPPQFVVFGADSSRTGWYGFPAHPDTGVVKIANHGPGRPVDPDRDPRTVDDSHVQRVAHVPRRHVPGARGCAGRVTRCCLYCDTPDEHFWIGRHPETPGLTVAAGDSGHASSSRRCWGGSSLTPSRGGATEMSERFSWRTVAMGARRAGGLPRAG